MHLLTRDGGGANCYPTPFEEWEREGIRRKTNNRATPQSLDQRSKMKEVMPKMAHWEAKLWDNPEGGELDSEVAVRKRCKKNSPSVLSNIGKRKNEGCA